MQEGDTKVVDESYDSVYTGYIKSIEAKKRKDDHAYSE